MKDNYGQEFLKIVHVGTWMNYCYKMKDNTCFTPLHLKIQNPKSNIVDNPCNRQYSIKYQWQISMLKIFYFWCFVWKNLLAANVIMTLNATWFLSPFSLCAGALFLGSSGRLYIDRCLFFFELLDTCSVSL